MQKIWKNPKGVQVLTKPDKVILQAESNHLFRLRIAGNILVISL